MTSKQTVAILGAGDMGHGIAELAAIKGFDVRLYDVDDKALARATRRIGASLDKLAAKDRLTLDEARVARGRIRTTTHLDLAVGTADIIIECVPERLALKQSVSRKSKPPPNPTLCCVPTPRPCASAKSANASKNRRASSASTSSTPCC